MRPMDGVHYKGSNRNCETKGTFRILNVRNCRIRTSLYELLSFPECNSTNGHSVTEERRILWTTPNKLVLFSSQINVVYYTRKNVANMLFLKCDQSKRKFKYLRERFLCSLPNCLFLYISQRVIFIKLIFCKNILYFVRNGCEFDLFVATNESSVSLSKFYREWQDNPLYLII